MTQPTEPKQAVASRDAHALDFSNYGNLGTGALTAFLRRLGENRCTVRLLAGRVAAELLTRDGVTQRTLENETGIPRSTIDRWAADFRAKAAA